MPDGGAFRAIRYRSADGRLELFARVYAAEANSESKPPLLMMHGLTRNSADFEPLIAALNTGRMVVVPDQRGRGQSQYDPDPANYRPDVYVADMWALLAELGVERVICIGTSMGGLMAMLMGAQDLTKIGGIALNDVGPELNEIGLNRIRSYVSDSGNAADWQEAAQICASINRDVFDGFSDENWLAFAKRTCRQLPDGQISFAYDPAISEGLDEQEPSAVPPDLWPIWDSLADMPALVIRGAKSDILTGETVALMAKSHGSEFDCVDVEGRGHAPLLDEPKAVMAICRFLDGL